MKGAVSERAPQKYLVQNHSGVRLFYWAERVRCRQSQRLAHRLACDGTAACSRRTPAMTVKPVRS